MAEDGSGGEKGFGKEKHGVRDSGKAEYCQLLSAPGAVGRGRGKFAISNLHFAI
jgi:hypothetical protein